MGKPNNTPDYRPRSGSNADPLETAALFIIVSTFAIHVMWWLLWKRFLGGFQSGMIQFLWLNSAVVGGLLLWLSFQRKVPMSRTRLLWLASIAAILADAPLFLIELFAR